MEMRAQYPVSAVVQQMMTTSRKNRYPKHSWHIRHAPWTVQPICIAPVIPGETMERALYQARIVTDPIKNPLIGWWIEYYWFYVKLRDLPLRDVLTEMMLDPAQSTAGLNSAAKVETYHQATAPDYSAMCLQRVVEEYFRDEGETYDAGGPGVIGGMPLAKVTGPKSSWLDSAALDTTLAAKADNDLQNPSHDVEGDLSQYQQAYERMQAMRMIDMTFDEWLGTFGVNVRKDEQQHIPELLDYHRDWSYPTNTVEATTGVPSSAVSWSAAHRLDKNRYFREPGFIFGVSICRPKVYLGAQKSSATEMLNTAESWMPAILGDQPWTSLRKFLATEGPVRGLGASPANDYWVDIRDLFLYGDQFLNFDMAATDAGIVALPKAGMQKHYVNATDRQALFVDATNANGKTLCRQDGVIDFTIKGPPLTTVDQTV